MLALKTTCIREGKPYILVGTAIDPVAGIERDNQLISTVISSTVISSTVISSTVISSTVISSTAI
jgi:hypothetical protein